MLLFLIVVFEFTDIFVTSQELDLSDIISKTDDDQVDANDSIYDLQSIVIHKGEYGSGHYYSYARPDIRSNDWYRFDDEFVTKVDYSDVIADAYGGSRKTQRKRPPKTKKKRKPENDKNNALVVFSSH